MLIKYTREKEKKKKNKIELVNIGGVFNNSTQLKY